MVEAVVVSDVHLGSAVSRAPQLQEVLAGLYPFRRLILLGDLLDQPGTTLPAEHHSLLDYINWLGSGAGAVVEWVGGNHDETAGDRVKALTGARLHDELRLEIGARDYLFLHGHQFDIMTQDWPKVTDMADRFYRQVQRLEGQTRRMSRWLKRTSKCWTRATNSVERLALERATKVGVDHIVCGHTHSPCDKERYINVGCWTDTPSSLLVITDGGPSLRFYR